MTPKFIHDCDKCQFHGTGKYRGKPADFYTCKSFGLTRSFIARYGDDGPEYASGPLFCCSELTYLDKVALFNHLELTESEEEHLKKLCVQLVKNQAFSSIKDCETHSCGIDLGSGNVMFPED